VRFRHRITNQDRPTDEQVHMGRIVDYGFSRRRRARRVGASALRLYVSALGRPINRHRWAAGRSRT
jgi:hypothetical protein